MRHWLMCLIAAALLTTACRTAPSKAPEPVPPEEPAVVAQPEPASPALVAPPPAPAAPPAGKKPEPEPPCLSQPRGDLYGHVDRRFVQAGTCMARIDSEPFTVTFQLPGSATAQAVRAALHTEGPVNPEIDLSEPHLWQPDLYVHLEYPAGKPGEQFAVRLKGPLSPGGTSVDLGFQLERVLTPGVVLQWRPDQGEWRLLDRPANLPRQPFQLRLQLVGGVPREGVERVLQQEGLTGWQWTGPEVLELSVPEPPVHLLLNFDYLLTPDYVPTSRSSWELFTGASPVLVAIDPQSGEETVVGNAPLNVAHSSLSPDGQWAVFFSVHPDSMFAEEAWGMNTTTGRVHRLGVRTYSAIPRWGADGLLIPWGGTVYHWRPGEEGITPVETGAASFVQLSQDGRWLAGFTYDARREGKDMMMPGSIVLYDTVERKEQVLARDRIQVRMPHSEFGPQMPMVFTPDGKGLIIREQPPEGIRWVQLDLSTEELTPATQPQTPKGLEWAVTGGYRVSRLQEYSPVLVYAPDGAHRSFGEGLVVGWRSDGRLLVVRWENARELRRVVSGF